MMLLSTLSTLVPYAFCSLAVFLPGGRRASSTRRPARRSIAALAFVYSLFAIGGAGPDVVYLGFLLILSGLPVYVWVERGKGQRAKGRRAKGRRMTGPSRALNEHGRLSQVAIKPVRDAFRSDAAIAREWRDLNFTAAPDFVTRAR